MELEFIGLSIKKMDISISEKVRIFLKDTQLIPEGHIFLLFEGIWAKLF